MAAATLEPLVELLDRNPRLLRLAELVDAQDSLAAFCARMDPTYEPARHTALLVEHLEAVERGDIKRLAVFMPPRHSKTYHVSERFPAWYLGRRPSERVILASYGAELAEGSSRKVRNLLKDQRWPWPGVRVAEDSSAVNKWGTNYRGEVIAAGVGGAMTGFGANLLVIDDPVKGRLEADSETTRETTWNWYAEVARTRLMPGGRIVLCQTRWHEDDLAGRILRRAGDWTVLELPALAREDDLLGRAPGEPLWPEWFGAFELSELRTDLTSEQGSRAWQALYQQRPTADEGGQFKRAWFEERWSDLAWPPIRVLAVDAAYKTGVMNDYSAIVVAGATDTAFPVLDVHQGRWEYPELKRQILEKAQEWQPHALLIEDTAAGQSVIQELRRDSRVPIVPVKVTASKEARAATVAPTCEARRVVLPRFGPFVGDLVDQLAAFPTGQHDDMCLVAGTRIATPFGDRPIETLRAGDRVITPLGVRRVLAAGPTGIRPIIQMGSLVGTPNHPVFSHGDGFKRMDAFTHGLTCDRLSLGGLLRWTFLRPSSSTESRTGSWGRAAITSASHRAMLVGSARRDFMSRSGKLITDGRFRRAGMFITKTVTRSITTLATWIAYRLGNMLRSRNGSTMSANEPTSTAFETLPLHGTGATKAAHGIASMVVRHGQVARPSSGPVSSVVAPSRRPGPGRNIAHGDASTALPSQTDAIDGLSSASCVAAISKPASRAALVSRRRVGGPAEDASRKNEPGLSALVFNLSVEGAGCYYANGVLVSNCDAFVHAIGYLSQIDGATRRPKPQGYSVGKRR